MPIARQQARKDCSKSKRKIMMDNMRKTRRKNIYSHERHSQQHECDGKANVRTSEQETFGVCNIKMENSTEERRCSTDCQFGEAGREWA